MGDAACVMHGFSYASAISNDSLQGKTKHALEESISFGRFATDQTMSWEKWSAFSSHNKYVEEAERYALPGSVAQKKALFEAHYKQIAAQKAAIAAEAESKAVVDYNASVDVKMEKVNVLNHEQGDTENFKENNLAAVIENCLEDGDNELAKKSEASGGSPAKRKSDDQLPEDIQRDSSRSTKQSRLDPTDKKRSSSKSLRALLNLVPFAEFGRDPISAAKNSPASTKGVSSYREPTSQSGNSIKVPIGPSAPGSKTGVKWRILSAICSKSLTANRKKLQSPAQSIPCSPRMEGTAKRKQDKAGKEVKKLSWSFCIKAQFSLNDYENGESTRNQVDKNPVQERSNLKKMQGTVSMPLPPPSPKCPTKKSASKNLSK